MINSKEESLLNIIELFDKYFKNKLEFIEYSENLYEDKEYKGYINHILNKLENNLEINSLSLPLFVHSWNIKRSTSNFNKFIELTQGVYSILLEKLSNYIFFSTDICDSIILSNEFYLNIPIIQQSLISCLDEGSSFLKKAELSSNNIIKVKEFENDLSLKDRFIKNLKNLRKNL